MLKLVHMSQEGMFVSSHGVRCRHTDTQTCTHAFTHIHDIKFHYITSHCSAVQWGRIALYYIKSRDIALHTWHRHIHKCTHTLHYHYHFIYMYICIYISSYIYIYICITLHYNGTLRYVTLLYITLVTFRYIK